MPWRRAGFQLRSVRRTRASRSMSYLPPGNTLLRAVAVEHRFRAAAGDRDQLACAADTAAARQQRRCRGIDRAERHADGNVAGARDIVLVELTATGHI